MLVPKHAQKAYALEHYQIKDLSLLPTDWNPQTHYADGRPKTPTWPLTVKETYVTPDGAWIVSPPLSR